MDQPLACRNFASQRSALGSVGIRVNGVRTVASKFGNSSELSVRLGKTVPDDDGGELDGEDRRNRSKSKSLVVSMDGTRDERRISAAVATKDTLSATITWIQIESIYLSAAIWKGSLEYSWKRVINSSKKA